MAHARTVSPFHLPPNPRHQWGSLETSFNSHVNTLRQQVGARREEDGGEERAEHLRVGGVHTKCLAGLEGQGQEEPLCVLGREACFGGSVDT